MSQDEDRNANSPLDNFRDSTFIPEINLYTPAFDEHYLIDEEEKELYKRVSLEKGLLRNGKHFTETEVRFGDSTLCKLFTQRDNETYNEAKVEVQGFQNSLTEGKVDNLFDTQFSKQMEIIALACQDLGAMSEVTKKTLLFLSDFRKKLEGDELISKNEDLSIAQVNSGLVLFSKEQIIARMAFKAEGWKFSVDFQFNQEQGEQASESLKDENASMYEKFLKSDEVKEYVEDNGVESGEITLESKLWVPEEFQGIEYMRTNTVEEREEVLNAFLAKFTLFYKNYVKVESYLNNYSEIMEFLRAYFDKRFFNQLFKLTTQNDSALVNNEDNKKLQNELTFNVTGQLFHEEVQPENQSVKLERANAPKGEGVMKYTITLTRENIQKWQSGKFTLTMKLGRVLRNSLLAELEKENHFQQFNSIRTRLVYKALQDLVEKDTEKNFGPMTYSTKVDSNCKVQIDKIEKIRVCQVVTFQSSKNADHLQFHHLGGESTTFDEIVVQTPQENKITYDSIFFKFGVPERVNNLTRVQTKKELVDENVFNMEDSFVGLALHSNVLHSKSASAKEKL